MTKYINVQSLVTGIVTGIALFLLYKHFVRESTTAAGVKNLEIVAPGS